MLAQHFSLPRPRSRKHAFHRTAEARSVRPVASHSRAPRTRGPPAVAARRLRRSPSALGRPPGGRTETVGYRGNLGEPAVPAFADIPQPLISPSLSARRSAHGNSRSPQESRDLAAPQGACGQSLAASPPSPPVLHLCQLSADAVSDSTWDPLLSILFILASCQTPQRVRLPSVRISASIDCPIPVLARTAI
jgi:hypothetical protein